MMVAKEDGSASLSTMLFLIILLHNLNILIKRMVKVVIQLQQHRELIKYPITMNSLTMEHLVMVFLIMFSILDLLWLLVKSINHLWSIKVESLPVSQI